MLVGPQLMLAAFEAVAILLAELLLAGAVLGAAAGVGSAFFLNSGRWTVARDGFLGAMLFPLTYVAVLNLSPVTTGPITFTRSNGETFTVVMTGHLGNYFPETVLIVLGGIASVEGGLHRRRRRSAAA